MKEKNIKSKRNWKQLSNNLLLKRKRENSIELLQELEIEKAAAIGVNIKDNTQFNNSAVAIYSGVNNTRGKKHSNNILTNNLNPEVHNIYFYSNNNSNNNLVTVRNSEQSLIKKEKENNSQNKLANNLQSSIKNLSEKIVNNTSNLVDQIFEDYNNPEKYNIPDNNSNFIDKNDENNKPISSSNNNAQRLNDIVNIAEVKEENKENWWLTTNGTFWMGIVVIGILITLLLIWPILTIKAAWLAKKKQVSKFKRTIEVDYN